MKSHSPVTMPIFLKSKWLWTVAILAIFGLSSVQVKCEAIDKEVELAGEPSDLSLIQDDTFYKVPEALLGEVGLLEEEVRPQRVKRFIKTLIVKGLILKKILILGKLFSKKKRPMGYGYGPSPQPQPSYGPPPQSSYGPPPSDSYGAPPSQSYGR